MKGTAYCKQSNALKPLSKGTFIPKSSNLILAESAEITAIDSKGEAFKIDKAGEYKFSKILQHKAIKNGHGLTTKYLKLIWDELTKKGSGKTIIGGVYRGDVLMEFPRDSTKIASSKLSFSWKEHNEDANYFIFIRNIETDEVYKFSTNGTSLMLYKDNPIFYEGNDYEWAVGTEEFPNLKNIPFYSFTLIERREYQTLTKELSEVVADLKALGLTDSEIEDSICEAYGICKN
ncbi:MAG: hypothetical protein Wins2KO_30180 [Winogradskyella sp.]